MEDFPQANNEAFTDILDDASSSGYRPFACTLNSCSKRFRRKYTLEQHLKVHTREKPYRCSYLNCQKTFSTSGNLTRHKKLHINANMFKCTVDSCHQAFNTKCKLKQHMRIHGDEDIYSCTLDDCTKTFTTSGNLTRHIKIHHSRLFEPLVISPVDVEDIEFCWPSQPEELLTFATGLYDMLKQ